MAIELGRIGGGWASGIVFNLWLRRQLRERRMTQRQLAARSGVNHSTISRLLGEHHRPSLETATKLIAALRPSPSGPDDLAAANYLERLPDEEVFPAGRVERALRADADLDEEDVHRLMRLYLRARRSNRESSQAPRSPGTQQPPPTPRVSALGGSSERAAPERGAGHWNRRRTKP